ncbi:hypothetical protein R84B8_01118 [Treponema sp. R8-4-B8]
MSVTAPVSLFTDIIDAKRTSPYLSIAFVKVSAVTLPVESTAILPVDFPILSKVSIPSLTEECSARDEITLPFPGRVRLEKSAILLDSVPPDVKYRVSGGTFKTQAHRFLASSRACFAYRPSR